MNFVIPKESLARLLYLTHSIVERRNTMPILANVKLTAENNKLLIAATDLEVSIIGEAEATVKTSGTTTVDARVFYDIVRELPNEPVTVSLQKNQRLEIQCGQASFKINGASADEFPAVAGVTLKKPSTVTAATLFEMFDRTAFAVSTDETRYNINGVLIESASEGNNKAGIRLVATDGHRLALIERNADGFSVEQPVIVPRKGIQEIRRVLDGNDGAASVGVSEGFFTVQSNNVTLGVRLVDGQFPDYRHVIPKETKTEVNISREALLSAIRRVSLVTTDKTKAVRCKVSGKQLTVSSSSPEFGEASETLSVEKTGEDVEIGFSAKYLLDILNIAPENEMVSINFSGELGPGVFTGSGVEAFTCVVMPMRFE